MLSNSGSGEPMAFSGVQATPPADASRQAADRVAEGLLRQPIDFLLNEVFY